MITEKLKELEATKAKMASLEKSIASELHDELRALPAHYGFTTVQAFIKAVKGAAGGGSKTSKVKVAAEVSTGGRRSRAKITDATRAEVKTLAEAGKTGLEIAQALGISLPSVQNIKKALGLVKTRK